MARGGTQALALTVGWQQAVLTRCGSSSSILRCVFRWGKATQPDGGKTGAGWRQIPGQARRPIRPRPNQEVVGYLPGAGRVPIMPCMFVVSEEAAAAIRTAYEQDGELSAAIELRRHFLAITDNAKARACARTIAGMDAVVRAAGRDAESPSPPNTLFRSGSVSFRFCFSAGFNA
jgi:hypothetical protein